MRTALVFSALLWAASHVDAHHSFATEYDATKRATLRGTIVKMEWVNPHCLLWIDVRGPAGVVHWGLELPPPNALGRRGIQRAVLRPGDTIDAVVYPAKNGRTLARAAALILPGGQTIAMSSY